MCEFSASRRLAPPRCPPSAGIPLAEAWGGLTLAYCSDWPASFWIAALSGMLFFGGAAKRFAG